MRRDEVAERVAAELVARRDRELPRHACFGDHRERLDGRGVAALDEPFSRLTRREVDRRQWPHQRRERLHRRPHDDLLAVRDGPLDTAGTVRLAVEATLVADDLIVRLRPAQVGNREAVADLDALHRLRPHDGGGQARIEPLAFRRVRPESRRNAACAHLHDAADRVAGGARSIDALLEVVTEHSTFDRDVHFAEQGLRDRAGRDDRGRVTRAGAFECVADVGQPVLERAGEVRMPRPRQRHRLHALARGLAVGRPGAHPPAPVLVVAIPDDERERRAERPAVPQAGEDLDGVGFDALPRAATVSLLPPPEIGVDRAALEDEARGQAGDDRDERRAVRLARGNELEHQAERTAACMTSTGADTPVQSSNAAAPCATSTSSPSTTRAPRAAAARAVAVAGYGRSTSVCPARSSTRTLSRSEVALTTRSASLT